MKILFMGSPELAVPSFHAARRTGDIVGVVTQPPRPRGRGRRVEPSPIAREAGKVGIPVMTPGTLRTPEIEKTLRSLEPDIALVVAYGRILPPDILAVPEHGCVNVHASLLPKLRGAAPIQWSIANGDTETGVTLMQMDEGMDTGPILLQRSTAIGPHETAGELGARLSLMGADLVEQGLPLIEKGALTPVDQDDSRATYAPLLTKDDGLIDWSMNAQEIARRVRGFNPWPGTYTTLGGRRLLVIRARAARDRGTPPGSVISAGPGSLVVACGKGSLEILALKPEGRREMTVTEFLSGHRIEVGQALGEREGEI